jgi:hypothetical protein
MRRLALSETARDKLVIVVVVLMKQGPSITRPNYPTTRFSTTTPSRPAVYYKNCAEAHADGRWDIPGGAVEIPATARFYLPILSALFG